MSREKFERTFEFGAEPLANADGTAEGASSRRYVLTGHLEFDGGPAHHVIDFDGRRVVFEVDAEGRIRDAGGKGHITVRVFRLFDALDEDFEIEQLSGTLKDGRLSFHIGILIPEYKKGYRASFDFNGRAK